MLLLVTEGRDVYEYIRSKTSGTITKAVSERNKALPGLYGRAGDAAGITRNGGEIYLGVVGPVRTGKSTFIKRFKIGRAHV